MVLVLLGRSRPTKVAEPIGSLLVVTDSIFYERLRAQPEACA